MELAATLDDAATRSADAVARLWKSGELSAAKDGIGVYKVPLCLAVDGQHGLANNALDEIKAHLERSPGVYAPPPLPDGVVSPDKVTNLLSEYRTYFDAVILAGAVATQRHAARNSAQFCAAWHCSARCSALRRDRRIL